MYRDIIVPCTECGSEEDINLLDHIGEKNIEVECGECGNLTDIDNPNEIRQ
jgi:uncharacterized Zn finger protein